MESRHGSHDEELVSFLRGTEKFEDIDGSDSEESEAQLVAGAAVNTEIVLAETGPTPNTQEGCSDGTCGFGFLRGSYLRRLNHFELFLALLTLFGLCGGLQGALKSASLTKLERRFNFDSTTSSLVLMANDIAFLPSVLVVSYFGSLGHQPRLLAFSCFGYGLAALMFALPHFIFGPLPASVVEGAGAAQQLGYSCPPSANASVATLKIRDARLESSVALALFLLSGLIEGLSVAPYFNLGVAFVDDITGDFSGVFIGLVIAAKILSPTLAYQLYGKLFVHFNDRLEPSDHRQRADPNYIPAWWLGFLAVGVLAVLVSIPMALFPEKPRFNPDNYRRREVGRGAGGILCRVALRLRRQRSRPRKPRSSEGEADNRRASRSLSGFLEAAKRLLSNPVYFSLMCGNMFEFLEINCVIAYMVKYLELHFRLSSGDAAVLAGIAGPGANVLGIVLSSVIAARVTWRVPQLAKFHAFVNCFGVLAALIGFLFVCPRLEFANGFRTRGTFVPDCTVGGSRLFELSPFRNGCNCSAAAFKPICIDGRNFFSPCAANCHVRGGNVSCACLYNSTAGLSTGAFDSFPLSQLRQRVNLLCLDECSTNAYIFVAVFTLIKLVRLSARSQEAVLQLRCVRPKDKALGLGINSFMFSLGGIWVPLFVGHLFDQACVFYDPRPSYRKTCLLFDTQRFHYSFIGFTTAALVPACACFFLAWYFTARDARFSDLPSRQWSSSRSETPSGTQPRGSRKMSDPVLTSML